MLPHLPAGCCGVVVIAALSGFCCKQQGIGEFAVHAGDVIKLSTAVPMKGKASYVLSSCWVRKDGLRPFLKVVLVVVVCEQQRVCAIESWAQVVAYEISLASGGPVHP